MYIYIFILSSYYSVLSLPSIPSNHCESATASDQPWPSATYQYRVLWVEADTQHISTVSLQSRHLTLRHTRTGDEGRFFPQLQPWSSSTNQRELCCFFVTSLSWKTYQTYLAYLHWQKKTCTNTWAYQRCLAAYFSISHLRWMPWHLRRSLQKTSETFEFSKRPHLRQSSDTEDMDHLSLGRR